MSGRKQLIYGYILPFVHHFHFIHTRNDRLCTLFGRASHPVYIIRQRARSISLDADILSYPVQTGIVSEETSATMRYILEMVVAEGSGRNGQVQGFRVGGKTATSQTLPRGSGRYISSFIGFAPADDPQVIAIAIINNPQGIYYGGQVAAPIIRQLYENILPYLGLEKTEEPEETAESGE